MDNYGILSLAPALIAVILAFITREALFSILCGVLVGLLITGQDLLFGFTGLIQSALGNADYIWVIGIEVFIGIMVAFFQKSGAIEAVANKQRGGMFAKGFLFGTQFKAYFEDDLWLTMARHAVTQAQRIQKAATEKGYSLYAVSPTNQVFLVLSHAQIERLKQNFAFELNGRVDEDHEAARFVCSWATKPEAVDALIAAL